MIKTNIPVNASLKEETAGIHALYGEVLLYLKPLGHRFKTNP